jgi:hypothetical protein
MSKVGAQIFLRAPPPHVTFKRPSLQRTLAAASSLRPQSLAVLAVVEAYTENPSNDAHENSFKINATEKPK